MSARVTLQDVAERAHVHRSTAARALNDDLRISEPVRRKVQALAQRLGYTIHPFVSALMQTRRTRRVEKHITLAYVTSHPTRYGWRPPHHDRPDFFPGAMQRARELGYVLEDFWLAEPSMTPERFGDILAARGISGLIVGRLPPGRDTVELEWSRFCSVAVGLTLRQPALHRVAENHFETVAEATKRCRERGYRRVGLVYARPSDNPHVGDLRLGAYLQQQRHFNARDRLPVCSAVPADERTFAAWFRKHRPDSVLAVNATAVVPWLRRLGLEVPREVGVVELGDNPKSDFAGVHYDPAIIGALAVETLAGLLRRNEKGLPASPHEILVRGNWQDGRTLPVRR